MLLPVEYGAFVVGGAGRLRRELMTGNEMALWIMAELRARTGQRPEAERLRKYGVEPDGSAAGPWEVEAPGRPPS